MQVHVRLYSRFREILPPEARGQATIELPAGATLGDLLAHLGITGRIKLLTVNGQAGADQERVLNDGDQVKVFPVIVGG